MNHILLIDDNEDIRAIYKTAFEAKNYQVTEAIDGKQGLELAQKGGYTAILCDLKMPKMDGLEFIELVTQKATQNNNGPLFVLSNVSYAYAKDEALKRGAVAFIHKDEYEPQEVVDIVEQHIQKDFQTQKLKQLNQ